MKGQRMRQCTMLCCILLGITGCRSWPSRRLNAHDQMVPRRSTLGAGLRENAVEFARSGLDENAVYVWRDYRESKYPAYKHPGETVRRVALFRFWPSGHVAFKTVTVDDAEEFAASHADDMEGAGVGRFVIPEEGAVAVEHLGPGNYAWHFLVSEGRISEDGDVIFLRQKRREDEAWHEWKIHGKKVVFKKALEYQPTW
jgi:hypothetical protein